MKGLETLAMVCCLLLSLGVLLPVAHADEWNQRTELTFSEPVQVPGAVLPAGTYWFVLKNNQVDRNVVQIFSEDYSMLYATELAIPTDRAQSTDRTEIKFAERPHHQPEAILKWYYPGLLTGHEFIYPSREENQFRHETKVDVAAHPMAANYGEGAAG
jgi:hypothetical protein